MNTTLVSLVVPCCDEEEALPRLWERFRACRPLVPVGCDLEYVFVDDGSVDRTWEIMSEIAAGRSDCVLVRNETRRGIGYALRKALPLCRGDIVAMLDADGTYDPAELCNLIGRLENADLVTGSPYHPEGTVRNVPAWRLLLSRSLSRLYRGISPVRVWTYTSLFRAYRREVLEKVSWESDGFLSSTEILIGAGHAGYRIEELPTTLSVREYGQSKLRTLSVIREHLNYLARGARKEPVFRAAAGEHAEGLPRPAGEETRGWTR